MDNPGMIHYGSSWDDPQWIIPGWSKMDHPRMIQNLYIYYLSIYTVWLLGWRMDHPGMIQNGSSQDDPKWIIQGWSKSICFSIYTVWLLGWRMDHPGMFQIGSSQDDPKWSTAHLRMIQLCKHVLYKVILYIVNMYVYILSAYTLKYLD